MKILNEPRIKFPIGIIGEQVCRFQLYHDCSIAGHRADKFKPGHLVKFNPNRYSGNKTEELRVSGR